MDNIEPLVRTIGRALLYIALALLLGALMVLMFLADYHFRPGNFGSPMGS